jgi:hypothetical protein
MVTGNAYREAIQNPQLNLADPELKRGDPVLDALGLPRAVSGNFAAVFALQCNGRRYAVKCFFNEFADQFQRYEAIHNFLHSVERSWEVEFEFQARGIRLGSVWHPIVKMEWIDAVRLDRYVEAHLHDRQALLDLARRFVDLVSDLRECGIAHGDLQHGNIMVTPRGELRLVDYDGMFVPALKGLGSHELGHPNYQHPARTPSDFDARLDNFSAWVIYISLVALAVDPSVWVRVNAGEEQLLFNRQDFEATIYSPGFGALQMSGDVQLAELAAELKKIVARGVADVPDLVPVDVMALAVGASPFAPSPPTPVATGLQGGLPQWLASQTDTAAPRRGDPSAGAGLDWMVGQLPPPPRVRFESVGAVPRRLLQAAAVVVLMLAVLGVSGVVAVSVDVAAGVCCLARSQSLRQGCTYLRRRRGRSAPLDARWGNRSAWLPTRSVS